MTWKPKTFAKDPTVNAILNVASAIDALAVATRSLLYGLKYSERDGMSVAEAIEVGCNNIGSTVADAIVNHTNHVE